MQKVIMFIHEESNKIVSKVCHGCNEIKLTEDFPKINTTLKYASKCADCIEKGEEE